MGRRDDPRRSGARAAAGYLRPHTSSATPTGGGDGAAGDSESIIEETASSSEKVSRRCWWTIRECASPIWRAARQLLGSPGQGARRPAPSTTPPRS